MDANLYTLLERHFPDERSQACVIVPGGPVVSYDELDRLSAKLANVLVDAGCEPGDRVAVQTDKHWQVLALYLATLRAGCVYLPLNTAYQRAELAYFFDDAKPRVIVCRDEMLGVIATLAGDATVLTLDAHGGELVDRTLSQPDTFTTVARAADDLAAIIYTSGTTGRSKGAMLTHRNLASNALALVEAWRFSHGDVLLHALPVFHVHGLFVAVHCALLSGARMLWLARFDAREVVALLPKATVMMGVPTFYTRLLAETSFSRDAAAGVRLFVSGSAPLLAETFSAFEMRIGVRILERYGLTETGMNTSNPYEGERIAGSVGVPLGGVAVRVVDGDGRTCANGDVGNIEVRGPNVCRGYWQMPDRTHEAFSADGWFRTGDLGCWNDAGYLVISGRAKDLIISGGLNIYPKEIEEHIDAMAGVAESAVVGIADPDFGEAVLAVVVMRDGHTLTEASIIASLRRDIAHFKVPRRVLFAADLPRNAMGKVQKNALRTEVADALSAKSAGGTAPPAGSSS